MPGFFITGTGTDIGKTWLCCALLSYWRAQGIDARAFKPIMSGVVMEALDASDAGQLLVAQGQAVTADNVANIAPWRFAAALSPDMAAAAEGRAIDWRALRAHSRRITSADFPGLTLIEGVGGVMVPLDDTHTVLDWMSECALPTVLVGGSYLGSMSHTLTALNALHSRGIVVTAIVINETPGSGVSLAATLASLRPHAGAVPLIGIPREACDDGITTLAHILHAA